MILFAQLLGNNTVAAAIVRSSSGPIQTIEAPSTTVGLWHHYALTVDSEAISLYVDGDLAAVADNLQFGDYVTSIDYTDIGRHRYDKPNTGDIDAGLFNGMIDDVRIYNRALSSNEIAAIYAGLTVSIDVKPTSCPNPLNVKSKGLLPVAIPGSNTFDVTTIDATSIRLEGVAPVRHSFEDVAAPVLDAAEGNCTEDGPDGLADLILKFETRQIVETFSEVEHGDVITLGLTGVLFNETPIEGFDCITIRGRYKPFKKGDINKDGMVDAADFAIMAQEWLQSSMAND